MEPPTEKPRKQRHTWAWIYGSLLTAYTTFTLLNVFVIPHDTVKVDQSAAAEIYQSTTIDSLLNRTDSGDQTKTGSVSKGDTIADAGEISGSNRSTGDTRGSEDNDISGCGLGPVVDNTMNCAGKADGAYCATVEGDVTSYVCYGHEIVTDGWMAPLVCEDTYPKCREVVGASYPVCGECSTNSDCADGEICSDDAECVSAPNPEVPTLEAFCAAHDDGDTACFGTVQYYCDSEWGNEEYDCKAENSSYGTACVIDADDVALCGCNTDADCATAAYGSKCIESMYYDGISQCGCTEDSDCADGYSCSTKSNVCLKKS
jgi:hypothetical protein